jgi:hypothetical protein
MKKDIILTKLNFVKDFIVRYAVMIFFVGIALVFGFLILKISSYSNYEPSDDQIEESLTAVRTVRLNDEAVQKIEELQDRNISLESLFNNGRANPFE